MRYFVVLLLIFYFNFNLGAHEKTTYPLLVNKELNTIPKSKLSIIVDPDIGDVKFRFILMGDFSKISNPENFMEINSSSLKFQNKAIFIKEDSNNEKLVYSGQLPLNTASIWNVEYKFLSDKREVDRLNIPLEVVEPGPSKLEFLIYFMPFLFIALVALKIWHFKRQKSTFIE